MQLLEWEDNGLTYQLNLCITICSQLKLTSYNYKLLNSKLNIVAGSRS